VIPLYRHARKLSKKSGLTLDTLKANAIDLITKRNLIIIITFTVLGLGGVFAASLITVTAADSQGAGYLAATSCDESIAINKDVVFNSSTKRFEVSTISISNVNQSYDANGRNGCGNQVLEMAFPINGSTTYASWTIPSSTITNGIFVFGGATGITYNAYTALTPVDAQSLATVALSIKPATRAVNNGPVYDVLKANGFTTTGQSGASSTITFALSLSCGVLTVDTTAPGVSTALAALTAPTGYVKNDATSTGADGATTAALLGFRGTVANINIVLPWISYNKTAGTACTSLPRFRGAIWDAQSASSPVAWNFSGNNHYYQYVETATASAPTWDASFTGITGQPANYNTSPYALGSSTRAFANCNYKLFGLCGYFVTVTSRDENLFIVSKTATRGVWLGGLGRCANANASASVICAEKGFFWVDPVAPEYGTVFSKGSTATAGNYANWTSPEPNGGSAGSGVGESALQTIGGSATGDWNDLAENEARGTDSSWGQYNVAGFIVEYGDSTAAGESRTGAGSRTSEITWNW
jgi:hypothetical protein